MKIVVCMKIVPRLVDASGDWENNRNFRDKVDSVINPADLFALRVALDLKDHYAGSEVIVISMGVETKASLLTETLALGADRAIILSDKRFSGADTLATAYILKCAIEYIDNVDLIICGMQSSDGETGQVGPGLASMLDIPFVTNADRVDGLTEHYLQVGNICDYCYTIVKIELPGLLAISNYTKQIKLPALGDVIRAHQKKIEVLNADDILADPERCGIHGSPTMVKKIDYVKHCTGGFIYNKDVAGDAKRLINDLSVRYSEILFD